MSTDRPISKRLFCSLCRSTFAVVVILLVLLAAALTTARWLAPRAADYRLEIEGWVSHYLGQPVSIGEIEMAWHGWGPEIQLRQVRISQLDGGTLQLNEAQIEFNLVEMVSEGRLAPSAMSVIGPQLTVVRRSDGSLALEGVDAAGEATVSLDWLLSRERLKLRNATLHWVDQPRGRSFLLSKIDLSLANRDGLHQLSGSVTLPPELGEVLRFDAELEGDLATPGGWDGRAYLHARGIESDEWIDELLPPWIALDGRSSLDLWGEWRGGGLQRLSGSASFARLAFPASAGVGEEGVPMALDEVSGRFLWQRAGAGWRFDTDRFSMSRDGRAWPEGGFSLVMQRGEQGVESHGAFSWLRIDDLAEIALYTPFIDTNLRRALVGLQPRGDLHDLQVHFSEQRGVPQLDYRVEVDGLAVSSWQGLPELAGLSGTLRGDAESGRLQLDSHGLTIAKPGLFRQPIVIDRLAGELVWQALEERLFIGASGVEAANSDVTLAGRMEADIPFDPLTPPFLDLQLAFSKGRMERIAPYMPVGIMTPEVVAWLDRALVSGEIGSGSVLVHGPLNAFPFSPGSGRFEVVAEVSDGVLDYAEGWPRLEGIEGVVRFDGASMAIESSRGTIFNSRVESTHVAIEDLLHPTLTIDGRVRGELGTMLDFVRATPLSEAHGELVGSLRGAGDAQLDLVIGLPLYADEIDAQTMVKLALAGNTLSSTLWPAELSGLHGELLLGSDGFSAHGVKGELYGRPVEVALASDSGGGRVSLDGRFAIEQLPKAGWLAPYLEGASLWRAELLLPAEGGALGKGRVRLSSDLDGVAVKLPPPFGKPATEARRLVAEVPLSGKRRELKLDYGNQAQGRFKLRELAEGMRLEGGSLHLGSGKLRPYDGPGIYLSGQLKRFDLDPWLERFRAGRGDSLAPPELIAGIDMDFGQFRGFGREFHDAELVLEVAPTEWLIKADAREVKGVVAIPKQPKPDEPLMFELQRLELASLEEGREGEIPDPRRIPALQINCGQLVFDGIEFGEMSMRSVPSEHGLLLKRLDLSSPVQRLHADGEWSKQGQRHQSHFDIDLHGDDIGKVLAAWGYAVDMEEGEVRARIEAIWEGAPSQFSLERMEGRLNLKIFDGRLLEVEPGVGRVFGLLGLQTLPRWLTFDFGDLFKKGFSYDTIRGDFELRDGNAHTSNLRMDGASAQIEVEGRTGLKQHDYDQVVTVTPKLTASLPVAGILAGGPAGGAVMWLADKLLGSKVNKLTSSRYSVVGGWDEPVVTKLGKQAEVEERGQ